MLTGIFTAANLMDMLKKVQLSGPTSPGPDKSITSFADFLQASCSTVT